MAGRISLTNVDGQIDQERDANSRLLDLDKGLRSGKVGEQCAAIVKFPRLFEKYPFPILINSSFLKLADVFRIGSNFLRLQVLTVTQQSEKHLDKILNVDEFVKRIFSVMHSNDPVARSITLSVLGSCASVIGERKNIHHSIINCLDSHDEIELKAAIAASAKFAAKSQIFASGVCNKLSTVMEGLVTPVHIKLKFIPVFQHMHYDNSMSTKVRSLCCNLLTAYPSRQFVLVTLHTMSLLAAKTLMDIPQQITLLLDYVENDPRHSVKCTCLGDLKLLANIGCHMWQQQDIQRLCGFVLDTSYDTEKIHALHVLCVLSSSTSVSAFDLSAESKTTSLCTSIPYHSNPTVASLALTVLNHLTIHILVSNPGGTSQATTNTVSALESVVVITTTSSTPESIQALKRCLSCIVALCKASESVINSFVDIIMSILENTAGIQQILLCECLSAICSHNNALLSSLLPDLLTLLQETAAKDTTAADHQYGDTIQVRLCTLIFQAALDSRLNSADIESLMYVTAQLQAWSIYKVARSAARFGQHQLASRLFSQLTTKVSSEQFHFWLHGLHLVTFGETKLETSADSMERENIQILLQKLSNAENMYRRGLIAIKAAAGPSQSLQFSCTYLHLRAQWLQCMSQLIKATRSFQTCPPPAIATSLVIATGRQVHKYDHIVTQLESCCVQLNTLCDNYMNLYHTLFDADPATLRHVKILRQSCQLLICVINTMLKRFDKKSELVSLDSILSKDHTNCVIEDKVWLDAMANIVDRVFTTSAPQPPTLSSAEDQTTATTTSGTAGSGERRLKVDTTGDCGADQLDQQHMKCIQEIVHSLTHLPLYYPRYLFQARQTTTIKLAVSPQPRATDPVTVHYDTKLTLTVEGVIQQHKHNVGLYRDVHKAHVRVRSKQTSQGQMVAEVKGNKTCRNDLTQDIALHNDYFKHQFLLSFPSAGLHNVTVEASVYDGQGSLWNTGPSISLTVKSYDEAVSRQQQHQYAAHRQQQRAAAATAANPTVNMLGAS